MIPLGGGTRRPINLASRWLLSFILSEIVFAETMIPSGSIPASWKKSFCGRVGKNQRKSKCGTVFRVSCEKGYISSL